MSNETEVQNVESSERRDFLRKAGKFAAATPPAAVLLFSTSLKADALALSGGSGGPRDRKKKHQNKRKKYGKRNKWW